MEQVSAIGESGDKHSRLLSSENLVVSAKLELYTLYKMSKPILSFTFHVVTPCNHYFWLDLSICQTFPRLNFVRVNSPNFTPAKLSRYTVYMHTYILNHL